MSRLMDKLRASGSIKATALLSESNLFLDQEIAPTPIPIINAALSGSLDGGLASGMTMLAGPSKHFKSLLGLLLMKSYMDKYPEAEVLFFDSEFGINPTYIQTLGINPDRILHIPVIHIEQLKFDIVKRLEAIDRGDKVFIFIDSIGNLASKKEVEDAMDEKSVADMTRAKALKSLFRIATPYFTIKDIPCVVVNHTYKEQALFPKDIVSGGTGSYYSSDNIWIIGRAQEKIGTDVVGWNFTINIEKSRLVKEKSKFTFTVNYESGINVWSGLLDLAIEADYVTKPKMGWYTRSGVMSDDKNWRESETNTKEFWQPILSNPIFHEYVKNNYTLSATNMLPQESDDEIEQVYEKLEE